MKSDAVKDNVARCPGTASFGSVSVFSELQEINGETVVKNPRLDDCIFHMRHAARHVSYYECPGLKADH